MVSRVGVTGGSGELGKNQQYHAVRYTLHGYRELQIYRSFNTIVFLFFFCRAERANEVYSDLKPITRCHSYAIQYKYNYKCTTCDFT